MKTVERRPSNNQTDAPETNPTDPSNNLAPMLRLPALVYLLGDAAESLKAPTPGQQVSFDLDKNEQVAAMLTGDERLDQIVEQLSEALVS